MGYSPCSTISGIDEYLKRDSLFMSTTQFDVLSQKFINLVMRDGKKLQASGVFAAMCAALQRKHLDSNTTGTTPKAVHMLVLDAIENVSPSVEVRRVRVAGTTYLVPAALPKRKQHRLAIRWLVEAARSRRAKTSRGFAETLAEEIFDAARKQGAARQKRDELHRLAEANRAYIRYRWW